MAMIVHPCTMNSPRARTQSHKGQQFAIGAFPERTEPHAPGSGYHAMSVRDDDQHAPKPLNRNTLPH
jgi:hypothetical protein